MKPMILIVEITTRDDKTETHECVDFPGIGSDFITLYKQGFVIERLRTEAVLRIKNYFQQL